MMNIEKRIEEFFNDNFERLKLEGGHSLTATTKQQALNQVLYYYKRMKDVADKVTDTEIKLTLPNLTTTQQRDFTIEGVVDIVKEEDETWMYDIKTHDLDYVTSHKELYEKQLIIYQHIWESIRGNDLDHTAIISTSLPNHVKAAIRSGDEKHIDHELNNWNPVVEFEIEKEDIEETVENFAEVVDKIENNEFEPVPSEKLNEKVVGTKELFVTRICRNCDARFSCESYREYVSNSGMTAKAGYRDYYNDFGTEGERSERLTSELNIETIPETEENEE